MTTSEHVTALLRDRVPLTLLVDIAWGLRPSSHELLHQERYDEADVARSLTEPAAGVDAAVPHARRALVCLTQPVGEGRPMTRIIAGAALAHGLLAPVGTGTRPTADRAREALFSSLLSLLELEGALVLDLYAGSGGAGPAGLVPRGGDGHHGRGRPGRRHRDTHQRRRARAAGAPSWSPRGRRRHRRT